MSLMDSVLVLLSKPSYCLVTPDKRKFVTEESRRCNKPVFLVRAILARTCSGTLPKTSDARSSFLDSLNSYHFITGDEKNSMATCREMGQKV